MISIAVSARRRYWHRCATLALLVVCILALTIDLALLLRDALAATVVHARNVGLAAHGAVALTCLGLLWASLRQRCKRDGPKTIAEFARSVRVVMDALAEGVVLLDSAQRIVLANGSFARVVDLPLRSLIGRSLDSFSWTHSERTARRLPLPWRIVLETGVPQRGDLLTLEVEAGRELRLSISVVPLVDEIGAVFGAVATFDDQTELHATNMDLRAVLAKVGKQQMEIERQNDELRALVTRDPLTGCLNRRAFFEVFEREFDSARKRGTPLACIMADIDHFKSINDSCGHAAGDQVIHRVADVLQSVVRQNDAICRSGGEEFCILLPGLTAAQAQTLAERMAESIRAERAGRLQLPQGREVTVSFGVSGIEAGTRDLAELMEQADRALYASKHRGRDRVTRFGSPDGSSAAA